MGSLYSGRCFETAADAADVAWSGVGPVVSSGSPPAVSTVEYSGGWFLVTRDEGIVIASLALEPPAFAVCDPAESVLDGVTLAFAVVGVWAAAWAMRSIGRAATGRGV
jgi:hypothetical protein